MKYVMITGKVGDLELTYPVIFPDNMVHSIVAEAIVKAMNEADSNITYGVGSAGHVTLLAESCYGESTTLMRRSKGKEDKRIINGADHGACIG